MLTNPSHLPCPFLCGICLPGFSASGPGSQSPYQVPSVGSRCTIAAFVLLQSYLSLVYQILFPLRTLLWGLYPIACIHRILVSLWVSHDPRKTRILWRWGSARVQGHRLGITGACPSWQFWLHLCLSEKLFLSEVGDTDIWGYLCQVWLVFSFEFPSVNPQVRQEYRAP